MSRRRLLHAIAILSVGSSSAHAQSASAAARIPTYRERLLGVYDDATGNPVDSVRVTDVLNRNSSLTTRTGTVSLFFLPDGVSLVRIQKLGYQPQTLMVAISPADTTPITLTLQRVTQLPAVVTRADSGRSYISPRLRGFEERRREGFGYFVGDSVLRANEGRPLANVIASRLPSIVTKPGRSSSTYLMSSARCVGGGPPQVFLDGFPLSPDLPPGGTRGTVTVNSLPFDLSRFDVGTLAGVEWYPDGVSLPETFGQISGRCGALLLWTRER